MSPNLQTQTVLLTGATSGIGKAAAIALASLKATVVMVGRDRARSEAALAEVKAKSKNDRVTLLLADLGSQAQVRQLAATVRSRHPRLDVLINNAGAIFGNRRVTVDGLEATFAVNHLGPFLLTHLLLDLLQQSAPARIVNVASAAARMGDLPFDDPNMEQGYSQTRAYGRSKLANILFTRELARRLSGTGVTTVAVHPGVVRTRFGETASFWYRTGVRLLSSFWLSPEQGADTVVWAASAAEAATLNGVYLIRRQVSTPVPLGCDEQAAQRLWELSLRLTHLQSEPGPT